MVMKSHRRSKEGKVHVHEYYGVTNNPGQYGYTRKARKAKASRGFW